jgi:hypothetical protein
VVFCHSEQSEESLFDIGLRKEREIPRFARNDKMVDGLFPRAVKLLRFLACKDKTAQAKARATSRLI